MKRFVMEMIESGIEKRRGKIRSKKIFFVIIRNIRIWLFHKLIILCNEWVMVNHYHAGIYMGKIRIPKSVHDYHRKREMGNITTQ